MRAARAIFSPFRTNTWLESTYRVVLKQPSVAARLLDHYVANIDEPSAVSLQKLSNVETQLVLSPGLGDPHRLLFQYSLSDSKDSVDKDGQPIFRLKYDSGDVERIKVVDFPLVEFLAKELLSTLGEEASPAGAGRYLDSLYEGHTFQPQSIPSVARLT